MNAVNAKNATNATNATNPKRILFIEANTDGTIGGSYFSLLEIIRHIDTSKYRPFVLFYQENSLLNDFKKFCPVIILDKTKGLIIKRDFPKLYHSIHKIPFLPLILIFFQKTYNFLKYTLPNFLRALLFLFRYKIDIVNINNAPTEIDWLIASKILNIKCIAHLRGNWEPKPLNKKLVKYYDTIISISNSVTEHAKRKGLYVKNFVTIHNGINIDSVLRMREKNPEEIKSEFNLSCNSVFLVGVIGNIKDWKGQHVAIQAIDILKKKYPEMKGLIVGDVSNLEGDKKYFKYLQDIVRDKGLKQKIIFTGYRKDIPDIISALDVLLLTSVAPEPFGRVILEGMVFSKPVIATAHGGPLEIIEDSISGFLVTPNNPEALAKKIDYLMSHPNIAKKAGQMARKRVEEYFTIKTNVKKTEQLYSKLLNIR